MKTITAALLLSASTALAACSGAPVTLPSTGDVTVELQNALLAANPQLGGSGVVTLKPGRYHIGGRLYIPGGVTLCGTNTGPFEPLNLMTFMPRSAILLLTDTTGPAINLHTLSSGISDVVIYYPNQVQPSATEPIPYPPAISMTAPSSVRRVTIVNAYDGIHVGVGRSSIENSNIGAFRNGITVDGPQDWVNITNVVQSIWWDIEAGFNTPQPIDAWVMSNSNGLNIGRADSLHVRGMLVYRRRVGITLGLGPTGAGYGSFSDIDIDGAEYGVVAHATNTPGAMFSNVNVSAATGIGKAAFYYMPGAQQQPRVFISNGVSRGAWAFGWASGFPAGRLVTSNVVVE